MAKKKKVLTRTLYTYVTPINNQWVRSRYKKAGFASYSEFMNALITRARSRTTKEKRKTT